MSVLNVFGRLLSSVCKSLSLLLQRPTKLATQKAMRLANSGQNEVVLIWEVLEGPFSREDFDEYELLSEGLPNHLNFMLVVLIEDSGVVDKADFWYETEEEALEVVKYFKSKIEPLEVT